MCQRNDADMSKVIIAQKGDCLINLSRQEGLSWEAVWNHPENAALRRRRKYLNIIKEGDAVFLPDLAVAEYLRQTDQLHKFVVEGRKVRFTLKLLDQGTPRAGEDYVLSVRNRSLKGRTDENGSLSEWIPSDASTGTLIVGANHDEFAINFGYIDPIEEISGVKSRLRNLGFYEGEINDEQDGELTEAIATFQHSVDLPGNGAITAETRNLLVKTHGS
jgi:Putative peptidoglycan binding domain